MVLFAVVVVVVAVVVALVEAEEERCYAAYCLLTAFRIQEPGYWLDQHAQMLLGMPLC